MVVAETVTCKAEGPLLAVPVRTKITQQDHIITIPHLCVTREIQPVVHTQRVIHEVPQLQIDWFEKDLQVPRLNVLEKIEEVPVNVAAVPRYVPSWDEVYVPRIYPNYVGQKEEVVVEMPKVSFDEGRVYQEKVIGEVTKKQPKVTYKDIEVYKYVDVIKDIDEVIDVIRYKPVYNVNIEMEKPTILPYAEIDVQFKEPIVSDTTLFDRELEVARGDVNDVKKYPLKKTPQVDQAVNMETARSPRP